MIPIMVVVGLLATVLLFAVFGGTIVYFLWPIVMVPVFHLPGLTWLQAIALTYICSILLKSSSTSK
jgi:hypothetical protein